MTGGDVLGAAVSLVLGYVLGSLPLPALVGRMSGHEGVREAPAIWRLSGPGWGLLAIAVDLARAVLPVTLAVVTFTWTAGVAAGIGAILGTVWPVAGRLPADRSPLVVIGVLLVIAPLAGVFAVTAAGLALALRRPSPGD